MRKLYSILSLLILFTSCDDFLDVKTESQVFSEDLLKTDKGYEDALYGIYSSLRNGNTLYGGHLSWYALGCTAQLWHGGGDINESFSKFDYESSHVKSSINSVWEAMYKVLSNINNILVEIDKSSGIVRKDFYKGEALGLRALLHFDLIRLYAPHIEREPNAKGIPYVIKFSSKETAFSSVSEVYTKIINDLLAAEKLLSKDKDLVNETDETYEYSFLINRSTHFNLYAVQALLARVYHYKGDLDNALIYAEKVIGSGKFDIEDKSKIEYLNIGTLNKKETIFGLIKENDLLEDMKSYFWNKVSFSSLNPIDEEDEKNPSENYLNKMNEDNIFGTDLRAKSYFFKNGSNWRFVKLVNRFKIEDEDTGMPDLSLTDDYTKALKLYIESKINGISILRLPEMYYIAAEALMTSNPTKARTYFDKVVESRGLIGLEDRVPEQWVNADEIYWERYKEYMGEGYAYYNMKKYNKEVYVKILNQTFPASKDIYVWPIPDSEFDYREN